MDFVVSVGQFDHTHVVKLKRVQVVVLWSLVAAACRDYEETSKVYPSRHLEAADELFRSMIVDADA